MYTKSPDWAKVFWKSYKDDGVDPSSSITRLINDCLSGRIKTNIFEEQVFDEDISNVSGGDIRELIRERVLYGKKICLKTKSDLEIYSSCQKVNI